MSTACRRPTAVCSGSSQGPSPACFSPFQTPLGICLAHTPEHRASFVLYFFSPHTTPFLSSNPLLWPPSNLRLPSLPLSHHTISLALGAHLFPFCPSDGDVILTAPQPSLRTVYLSHWSGLLGGLSQEQGWGGGLAQFPLHTSLLQGRPEQSRWLFCHHLLIASVAPYCLRVEAKFLTLDLRGILSLVYLKDLLPHGLLLMKYNLATRISPPMPTLFVPLGPKPLPRAMSSKGQASVPAPSVPIAEPGAERSGQAFIQTKCPVSLCSVLATGDTLSASGE